MAGGLSHPLNIVLRLTGLGEVQRQLKTVRQQFVQFERDVGIDLGYLRPALSGKGVTPSQRRQAFAELGFLREHGTAEYASRIQAEQAAIAQGKGDPAKVALLQRTLQQFQAALPGVYQAVRIAPGREPGLFHSSGMLMNAIRGLTGISVIGGVTYGLMSTLRRSMASEYGRELTVANLMNRMAPENRGLGGFIADTRTGGAQFGFNPEQQTQFQLGMGRLGGAAAQGRRTTLQAMQLTRAFGLDPQQGASMFGGLARMGMTDETAQKKFAGFIAEAVQTGRLKGREGEVWESVVKATDAIQRYLGLSGVQASAAGANLAAFATAFATPGISPGVTNSGMQAWMQAQQTIAGMPIFGLPPGAVQGLIGTVLGRANNWDPLAMYQTQQGFLTQGTPQEVAGRFTNVFQLARQAGGGGRMGQLLQLLTSSSLGLGQTGPEMLKAMYSSVLPGTGQFAGPPTPGGGGRALEQIVDKYQKKQVDAQKLQELRATLEERLAASGQKLIKPFGDLIDLFIKLTPWLDRVATSIAHFADEVESLATKIERYLKEHTLDVFKTMADPTLGLTPKQKQSAAEGAKEVARDSAAIVALLGHITGFIGTGPKPFTPTPESEAKSKAEFFEFLKKIYIFGTTSGPVPPSFLKGTVPEPNTTPEPEPDWDHRPAAIVKHKTPPIFRSSKPTRPPTAGSPGHEGATGGPSGVGYFGGGMSENIEGTLYIVDSTGTYKGKFTGVNRRPATFMPKGTEGA